MLPTFKNPLRNLTSSVSPLSVPAALGSDIGSKAVPILYAPMATVVWVQLIMALLRPWSNESKAVWAELVEYHVKQAWVCKDDPMDEHEYVIVDLSRPGQKNHLFLRLDGLVRERKDTLAFSPSTSTLASYSSGSETSFSHSSPPTSRISIQSSDISSGKYSAADTVENVNSFPRSAQIIRTVEFTSHDQSKRPSLWDLMIIAYVIYENSMTHEILERRSFWFVDIVSAMLEKWSKTGGDIAGINSKPTGSDFLDRRGSSARSQGAFVTHRQNSDLIDDIWGKFWQRRQELNNERYGYEIARSAETRKTEDLARQVEELKKQQRDRERQHQQQMLMKDREWGLRLQQKERENDRREQLARVASPTGTRPNRVNGPSRT